MSNLLLFLGALHSLNGCPETKIKDWTTLPWTQQDTAVYVGAADRCKTHFGDTAPCLKVFIKKGEHTYYAVCGKPTNKADNSRFGRNYWFTIIDTQTTGQQDSVPSGATSENSGCGRTCPNRPKASGGGK